MSAVQKFLFRTNFDEPVAATTPVEVEEETPPPPSFSEEELEAVRRQALLTGLAQGREEATRELAQASAESLRVISEQLDQLSGQLGDNLQRIENDTLLAAVTTVRKLFPALARREEMQEIEAVLKDCMQRLHREPRIVVRLSEEMLDSLKSRIDGITRDTGFEGRLVLLSEADFQPSEVKVEWADGGAERNTANLWSEIESRLQHSMEGPLPDQAASDSGIDPATSLRGPNPNPADGATARPEPAGLLPEDESPDDPTRHDQAHHDRAHHDQAPEDQEGLPQ